MLFVKYHNLKAKGPALMTFVVQPKREKKGKDDLGEGEGEDLPGTAFFFSLSSPNTNGIC